MAQAGQSVGAAFAGEFGEIGHLSGPFWNLRSTALMGEGRRVSGGTSLASGTAGCLHEMGIFVTDVLTEPGARHGAGHAHTPGKARTTRLARAVSPCHLKHIRHRSALSSSDRSFFLAS
jgi:hypothetical protein